MPIIKSSNVEGVEEVVGEGSVEGGGTGSVQEHAGGHLLELYVERGLVSSCSCDSIQLGARYFELRVVLSSH